jgi:uncharacterized protein (DUF1778 family)
MWVCRTLTAQSVLLDQVFFNLDDGRFRQFTALLDAPVRSNPGLKRFSSDPRNLAAQNPIGS